MPYGSDRRRRSRRRRPLQLSIALVLSLAGAAAIAVASGVQLDQPDPTPEPDAAVDLPGREQIDPPDLAERNRLERATAARASFHCEPLDCSVWSVELEPGTSEVAEDRILRAGQRALTAVSIDTGETLWHHDLVGEDDPALASAPRIHVIDGFFALAFAQERRIEVRSLADGALRWQQGLDVDRVSGLAVADDLLIVAGWPFSRTDQSPAVLVTGFALEDGEHVWDMAVHRAVSLETDPMLVLSRPGELLALDPGSGQRRWEQPVNGPVSVFAGDGRFSALVTAHRVNVLDTTTGQSDRSIARSVTGGGGTRVLGHAAPGADPGRLLAVNTPYDGAAGGQPRLEMTVVALADELAPTQPFGSVTGLIEVEEAVFFVSQTEGVLTLRAVDLHGDPLWTRLLDLRADEREGDCCWSLVDGPDPSSIYLVGPDLAADPIRVIDTEDGATTASFSLPSEVADARTVNWQGGLAVAELPDHTIVAGPAGSVRLAPGTRLLQGGDQPVVSVTGGVMGLQADLFHRRR